MWSSLRLDSYPAPSSPLLCVCYSCFWKTADSELSRVIQCALSVHQASELKENEPWKDTNLYWLSICTVCSCSVGFSVLQRNVENGVQKAKQQERRSLAIHFQLDCPVAMEAAGNNVIVDVTAYGIRL